VRLIQFSPGQDIRSAAAAFVDAAQTEILVNCYGFSDPAMVDALIMRHSAGCHVSVVVDKTQAGGPADVPQLARLTAFGIVVVITSSPTGAIDHEKVMIRDRSTAWWGSYNFSQSAQKQRNYAEVDDDPAVVAQFLADWTASHDWGVAHPQMALVGAARLMALTAIANDAEMDV
jgi:phosphatidylserine/phosphatidylglycerophosphate/cardiolipin synthase-like enzyme